ncbi:MAG: DNA-processing protein DprA [Oscillibacter sp.]|nr:DNA-processing protein DprA [Oscillibacter sp.]
MKYWLWLTNLRGLRNQTRLALLRHFGTPENLYYADEGEILLTEGIDRQQADLLKNRSLDTANRILGECQRLNIQLLTLQDAAYPGRLRDIYDPPCLLYVRGHLPVLEEEAVIAVVGTRNCTPYGMACTERISYGLATGGAIVASGLAKGIDAAASRGALLAGGVTLGLLGCGLDVVYPWENRDLYEDVAAAGALISEYPPGTRPLSGNFPQRNRILAGISVGALVAEAPLRSGALITASLALDQGRDVFAVPGPIDAPSSMGCNRLIQEGAALVTRAEDILQVYAVRFPGKLSPSRDLPAVLEEQPPLPEAVPAGIDSGQASDGSEAGGGTGGGAVGTAGTGTAGTGTSGGGGAKARPVIDLYDSGLTDDQIALMKLLDTEEPILADDLIEASEIPTRRVLSALTVLEIDGRVQQFPGKRYVRTVDLRDGTED